MAEDPEQDILVLSLVLFFKMYYQWMGFFALKDLLHMFFSLLVGGP